MTQRPTSVNSHHSDAEEYVAQEDIAEVIIDDGTEGDHPMDDTEDDQEGELIIDEDDMEADEEIVLEDTSIQAFTDHTKSVFAVALHPSAPLAVSGGEDDAGFLWDTSSGDMIMALDGHEDSVVAVGFSHSGDMVATGGMDGKVRVWKQKDGWKNWEFLVQLDGVDEVVVSTRPFAPDCPLTCEISG
jgi:ribosome assembly protein SQT1